MNIYKLSNKLFSNLLLIILTCSLTKYMQSTNYFKELFGIKKEEQESAKVITIKDKENKQKPKEAPAAAEAPAKAKPNKLKESKQENQGNEKVVKTEVAAQTIEDHSGAKNINSLKDFNSEVLTQDAAIVKFSATYCGPCHAFKPVMEKIKEEYSGKIKFFDLDLDEAAEIAGKYNVKSIPTLIFLSHGIEKGRLSGSTSEQKVKSQIKEYLNI